MSGVFWDTMLFVYLLEPHGQFSGTVESLLQRSKERNDVLLTSCLSLAELLVGLRPGGPTPQQVTEMLEGIGFGFVEFDRRAVEPFRVLRREVGLRTPDAMNVACAAGAGVDLFLTGDRELVRKRIRQPGIQFMADFQTAPL